jgi:lipopolysaccharide export system protein LptC
MSQAATRERAVKQVWAVPGSRHDRLVRLAKIALPSAVGVLLAFLFLAPLDRSDDVSFILDKKKVDNAQERMRVDLARYVGQDKEGRPFTIVARSALQRSSEVPIVDIEGMMARLGLSQGPLAVAANRGQYDLNRQQVAIVGPVRVSGADGYQLQTRDVTMDLKQHQLTSAGPASGQMRLGQFQAGRLQADLNQRNVVLDKGVRLKIVQGAVR